MRPVEDVFFLAKTPRGLNRDNDRIGPTATATATAFGVFAMPLARAFALHNNAIDIQNIPVSVVDKARTCLIDYLSSTMGDQDFPLARHALALAAEESGDCTIPATRIRTSLHQAAFTGAVLSGATSQIDTHPESASHPGSAIWPALLALGEAKDLDGADLLAGAIAAYEVSGRLGRAIFGGGGAFNMRPTGVLGAAAAAAGCARLLRLDVQQSAAAICIAANTAGGLMEWARTGTTEHMFHAGFAARNGITAALLARAGSCAADTTLEGPSGMIASFRDVTRSGIAAEGLGSSFEINAIQHKQTPACLFVQTPCQAALTVATDRAYGPERIEEIRVHVCGPAIAYPGCNNPGKIGDMQAARLSIQFSVAAVLWHGRIATENWREFSNPAVTALAAKVILREEARFSRNFPKLQGALVEVDLEGGKTLVVEQEDLRALGCPELSDRLHTYAQRCLGIEQAGVLTGLAKGIGAGSRVRELMQEMRLRD